jgi:Family of unknown function (DUF5691)
MNTWETLVASAVVGTSRQEPSIDLTHPALSDYAEFLQTQSAKQKMLSAAGLVAAYQAVGKSAELASLPLLSPAPEDNLPCCSKLTAQHLNAVLTDNKYEPILPELLQLLAQAGQTVPPDFLPLLLNLGKRESKLRELILPILGSRGQWLVRQNPDWKYALGAAIEVPNLAEFQEIWTTGTNHERLAALTQWRQIQPASAREAVVANWKQDKAESRQAWLEVFQTNLSLDDEEFLEVALFDRSEPVRQMAANLLRQLPSQYRQRLTKLASQSVTIEEKGGRYKIDINIPDIDDKEWQLAGVSNKRLVDFKPATIPESMLFQVISAADLDIWAVDIDRLLAGESVPSKKNASLKQHISLLKSCWVKAACCQHRRDWIEALLIHNHSILDPDDVQQLLQSLAIEDSDFPNQFFTRILTTDEFTICQNLQMMMAYNSSIQTRGYANEQRQHRENWTVQFSDLVVRQFDKYIRQINSEIYYYYQQQSLCDNLGQYLDVSVLPTLQQMQSTLSTEKFNYTKCIELLEFRRDMRSSFKY